MEFGVTIGIGFTNIENEREVPKQLFDIGVTVITLTTGTKKLLLVVNAVIFPVPETAVRPVATLVLVQLKIVFATGDPLKITLFVNDPLQRT